MPVSRRLQAQENRLYLSPKTRISGFGDYFQIPGEGKTMNRRLYFLLPDRAHALSVVNELAGSGLDLEQMHALAGEQVSLEGLPEASDAQRHDLARHLETFLWDSNLVVFGVALGALLTLGLSSGLTAWLLLPLAIMLASFLAGLRFTRLPNVHLDEFRDALSHGEILLMVDVPVARVADIENRVHRHHPEAAVGGVGWGTTVMNI
jgi:hypothetical protein